MRGYEVVSLPTVRKKNAVGSYALGDDRLAHHEAAIVIRLDQIALLDATCSCCIFVNLDLGLRPQLIKPGNLEKDGLCVVYLVDAKGK